MNYNLDRIEQLKHEEELLGNVINYLWEIWGNKDLDEISKGFSRLGFTEEDLDYWYITEEIDRIKTEIENTSEDILNSYL